MGDNDVKGKNAGSEDSFVTNAGSDDAGGKGAKGDDVGGEYVKGDDDGGDHSLQQLLFILSNATLGVPKYIRTFYLLCTVPIGRVAQAF